MKRPSLGSLILAVLALWAISGITIAIFSANLERAGQLGDMFGLVNALFSGLAFSVLFLTVQQQQEALKLQQMELDVLIQDQKETAAQVERQNKLVNKQQFEATFFKLLDLNLSMTNSYAGVLESNSVQIGNNYFQLLRQNQQYPKTEALVQAYNVFKKSNRDPLRLYIESLFNALEFIENAELSEKKFYFGLVRSYISHKMKMVVFYYLNCTIEGARRKILIEDNELLRDFNFALLVEEEHRNLIGLRAFGLN